MSFAETKYNSTLNTDLWQDEPEYWQQKPRNAKNWGWTSTICGYQNEASRLSACIVENHKMQPSRYWFVTINYPDAVSTDLVKSRWKRATRNLVANGIVGLWVREVNKENKVHYHLLVRDHKYTETSLRNIIKASITDGHRLNVQQVKNLYATARYILKVDGEPLLFHKKLGLQKYGVINKTFWAKPLNTIKAERREREKLIADARDQPEVERQIKKLYKLVSPSMSRKQVERTLAQNVLTFGSKLWASGDGWDGAFHKTAVEGVTGDEIANVGDRTPVKPPTMPHNDLEPKHSTKLSEVKEINKPSVLEGKGSSVQRKPVIVDLVNFSRVGFKGALPPQYIAEQRSGTSSLPRLTPLISQLTERTIDTRISMVILDKRSQCFPLVFAEQLPIDFLL